MAWDKVGSGAFDDGSSFVVERRAVYLHVPKSASTMPIQLRSYRWRLVGADGTVSVQAREKSREAIDSSVRSYGASVEAEPPPTAATTTTP